MRQGRSGGAARCSPVSPKQFTAGLVCREKTVPLHREPDGQPLQAYYPQVRCSLSLGLNIINQARRTVHHARCHYVTTTKLVAPGHQLDITLHAKKHLRTGLEVDAHLAMFKVAVHAHHPERTPLWEWSPPDFHGRKEIVPAPCLPLYFEAQNGR